MYWVRKGKLDLTRLGTDVARAARLLLRNPLPAIVAVVSNASFYDNVPASPCSDSSWAIETIFQNQFFYYGAAQHAIGPPRHL